MEVSGEGLPQIVKRLEAKDYRYGRHILPHDVEARELGTGVSSRIETLEKLGVRTNIDVIPQQEVADGINATRLMLSRCWFDAEKLRARHRGAEAVPPRMGRQAPGVA
jgi:phage terminase large subunit